MSQITQKHHNIIEKISEYIPVMDKEITSNELNEFFNEQVLNLNTCMFTDNELISSIEKHQKNLTEINLSNCKNLTDETLKYLSKLPNLKSLVLRDCVKFTDKGASALSSLVNLEKLQIYDCPNITDKGFENFTNLKNLTSFALNISPYRRGIGITDIGVKILSKSKNLKELDLRGCSKITDQGVKDISQLKELTNLSLKKSKITDAGVEDLLSLKNLNVLNLRGCSEIQNTKTAKENLIFNLQNLRVFALGKENLQQLEPIRRLISENRAIKQMIHEKSEKFGIFNCEYTFDEDTNMNTKYDKDIGSLIKINPLYLISNKDIDSFLLKHPADQEKIKNFLSQKDPLLLNDPASNLIRLFNLYFRNEFNKIYSGIDKIDFIENNQITIEVAKEILIMHALGKLTAAKRFILTHELAHARDESGAESLGTFDTSEFNFIKPHQYKEVRADLTAARDENAHDVGISYFEWFAIIDNSIHSDDNPHPTDANRVKALQLDREILRRNSIS